MSFTIQNTPKYSYIRKPVYFGEAVHRQLQMQLPQRDLLAQNIVHVFTERLPVKDGGLGEVAKTTTEAQAEFMPEKDVRVIVPYQKAHRDEDKKKPANEAFKDSGVVISEKDKYGRTVNFKVLQKFEYATGFNDKVDHFTDVNVKKKIGNWVYALRADEYFIGKNDENQDTGLYKYTYNPDASDFDKLMMYNRAAAKLVPMLAGDSPGAPNLEKFHNNLKLKNQTQTREQIEKEGDRAINTNPDSIDVVLGHDWLSGPVLNELPDLGITKKIDMVHNKYDGLNTPEAARLAGLVTPKRLDDREESFSSLRAALEPADGAIVNDNFASTLLNTKLAGNEAFVSALRGKVQAGRTFNMHHGLGRDVTPCDVRDQNGKVVEPANKSLSENFTRWKEVLEQEKVGKSAKEAKKIQDKIDAVANNLANSKGPYQFVPLKVDAKHYKVIQPNSWKDLPNPDEKLVVPKPTVGEMREFKSANKMALQRKWGLTEDPNAIMLGWAARLEPRQKGFFLMQKSMENVLKKAEGKGQNVQFVMLGNTEDPQIIKWIAEMNQKYPGKLYIPNAFANQDEVKQMNAACDFTVLPSLYEPYGLTQLEAMKMGSIPIVHGVDGLRTTVNDPHIVKNNFKKQANPKPEKVWEYPQNGFLMAPMDIDAYSSYTNQRMSKELLETAFTNISTLHEKNKALRGKFKKDAPIDDATQKIINKNNDEIGDNFKKFVTELKNTASSLSYAQKQATLGQQSERATQLEADAARLVALQNQLERQGHITDENLQKAIQLVQPDKDKNGRDLNDREAAKLTEAMERAISKTPNEIMKIRLNAFDYVNTEHAWVNLINRFYKPVFEASTLDQQARLRHTREMAEQKAKPSIAAEPQKEYVQTRSGNVKPPSGLSKLTFYYLNRLMELNQQFWAAIGRIFSLRKD